MAWWVPFAAEAGKSLFNAATDSLFGGNDGPGFQAQLNDQVTANNRLTEQGIHSNVKAISSAAKEYGIHELALLGQMGYSPSFQSSGSDGREGPDLSGMGQGVGRAIETMLSKEERAINQTGQVLALEKEQAEIDLLKAQTSSISRTAIPPRQGPTDTVVMGQGNAPLSIFEGGVSPRHPRDPSRADLPPMTTWRTALTPDGREVIVMSPEAANMAENDWVYGPRWHADMAYAGITDDGVDYMPNPALRWGHKLGRILRGR